MYCIKYDWFHPTYPVLICLSREMHFPCSIMKEIIFLLLLCTAFLYEFSVLLTWLLGINFFLISPSIFKDNSAGYNTLGCEPFPFRSWDRSPLLFWCSRMLMRHVLLWCVFLCRQIGYFSFQLSIVFLCFTILSPLLEYDFKRLFSQMLNASCY